VEEWWRSGGGGGYGQGAGGKSESGRDGGVCPGLISTRWPAWHGCFTPSHTQPCAPNPDAKALFGACSAPSAALWRRTHAFGTQCCCDWRARQVGRAARLDCGLPFWNLYCSALFCSVLCAGRGSPQSAGLVNEERRFRKGQKACARLPQGCQGCQGCRAVFLGTKLQR